jgi:hypothetical protein
MHSRRLPFAERTRSAFGFGCFLQSSAINRETSTANVTGSNGDNVCWQFLAAIAKRSLTPINAPND